MPRAPARIPRNTPQPKRKPNERVRHKHREFIRDLPCLACFKPPPSECAHVRSSGDGGMGLKPADRFTVPLCGPSGNRAGCHAEQHRIGESEFFARLGIDAADTALRLWAVTGDADAGLRAIERARQAIALHRGNG